MEIDIITIFPEMFQGFLQVGLLGQLREKELVRVGVHDLRQFAHDRHRTVDDYPFGGGPGMVFKPEPLFEAVEALKREGSWVILLDPQGVPFHQALAQELARRPHLLLLCTRYEGVDERVREHLADQEISLGDFVLCGGEVAAMVVVEAVARLQPGALGSPQALEEDSHTWDLLEYPQYTRPPDFRGWTVPEILLSGHHAKIARWRREQALVRTLKRRPELLEKACLTREDRRFLEIIKASEGRDGNQT
ncbi:MAG: tRNA (guanosine(37)-N1)-methyltransferase TrmD [Chloroflexi bacterium]|nr:tRNA (guanosine(37)-N1)-methyltransferase TrmD [Chloroflexota bacterium]